MHGDDFGPRRAKGKVARYRFKLCLERRKLLSECTFWIGIEINRCRLGLFEFLDLTAKLVSLLLGLSCL